MRFGSRSEVLPLFAALVLVLTFPLSPVAAETLLEKLPQSQPRLDMTWSEVRQTRTASFKKLRQRLNVGDAYATLNALHVALTTIGDGQTYVWGRPKRQLHAMITPTRSFRGDGNRVCRNLTITIALGNHIKRTETIACRGDDKGWQIEG